MINQVADWMLAHVRIVMPAILTVCVLVTVIIAISARGRTDLEGKQIPQLEALIEENGIPDLLSLPEMPMELNKYPEVNALIHEYYQALADGDAQKAASMRMDLDELGMIRIEVISKYIDHYQDIQVYTKDGLTEGSYMVYVTHKMKFNEIDSPVPGMMPYYVMTDDDGKLWLYNTDPDENVRQYVILLNFQDNLVDLNNKITAEYNDLLASDKEVEEYIAYMADRIREDVGVILAQMQQPEITADMLRDDQGSGIDGIGVPIVQSADDATYKAVTTAVVNIRSSDSETADRIDRAAQGQEFIILEQKGNGWSRISYQGRDAYIKSEFLEITSQMESAASADAVGMVKVLSNNVRVRGSASTNGDVLGSVQTGERLELVEEMSNGWSKVKFNNQIGYIRSDLVEKE